MGAYTYLVCAESVSGIILVFVKSLVPHTLISCPIILLIFVKSPVPLNPYLVDDERNNLQVYAALVVQAIKDMEEDNQASRAELKGIRGRQGSSCDDDRTEYMGWVIDDFPGNAEQV